MTCETWKGTEQTGFPKGSFARREATHTADPIVYLRWMCVYLVSTNNYASCVIHVDRFTRRSRLKLNFTSYVGLRSHSIDLAHTTWKVHAVEPRDRVCRGRHLTHTDHLVIY